MEQQMKDFSADGYVSLEQSEKISELVKNLLPEVRKNAVALVDSFDISDMQLNSALGRYDGKAYETMFEWTKDEPLNKTDVAEPALKWLRTIPKL
jgi:acyl-CoA oxidase